MSAAHPRIARFVGDRETGLRKRIAGLILPIAVAWRGPDPLPGCDMSTPGAAWFCTRCSTRFVTLDDVCEHVRRCPRPRRLPQVREPQPRDVPRRLHADEGRMRAADRRRPHDEGRSLAGHPARYTEHIGRQLLAHLGMAAAS